MTKNVIPLSISYPEISKEWDYVKNGSLSPENVARASNKVVWWICLNGHSYKTSIDKRTLRGYGCPYCSGKRVLQGFNDLQTKYPDIAKEWDFKKNEGLTDKKGHDISTPNKVTSHSNHSFYWICQFGHSYKAKPNDRISRYRGCPICAKEIQTSFAEQALYFYIKKLYPDAVNGDTKKIGMELDIYIPSLLTAIEYDGNRWHDKIEREKKKNKLCLENGVCLIRVREDGLSPHTDCLCINNNYLKSDNGLSDVVKEVLMVLDNTSGLDVDIDRDAMRIYSMYISECKRNSLSCLYPDIAKEWHPTLNQAITAEMVTPFSEKKVHWLGECGHSYLASVKNKVANKSGCPFCSGRSVLKGFNDLESQYSEVCKNWDYDKNNIKPDAVTAHSNVSVCWKCHVCGYEWNNKINEITNAYINRNSLGCGRCSGYVHPKIMCIETGVVYESGYEAEKATGIVTSSINKCCKGERKSAGGYHWKYLMQERFTTELTTI